MIDTLWGLALALAVFFGVHLVPGVPGLRKALKSSLGDKAYRGIFSVISIGGLVWIVLAHMDAPYVELWAAPNWTRLIPLVVLPFAILLTVCAQKNCDGIKAVTRHPMLWSVVLWALPHIPPNGDAASLMLFGTFALFALIDQPLADARLRREEPERWREIAGSTSAIPFAAAIAGRAKPRFSEIGYRRIGIALVLYVVILFGHEYVIGLSPMP